MYIVTAEEMYEIDRYAIEHGGIDGRILMENAGRAIAERLIKQEAGSQAAAVIVGSGNNGGDGFVIARYLLQSGFRVKVYQLASNQKITGDALYHKQLFINQQGLIEDNVDAEMLQDDLPNYHFVVDAILGIGVKGEIRSSIRPFIDLLNKSDKKVISVDIPSGLPANEGIDKDIAVKADFTYVVESPKQSLFTEWGAPYYGEWEVVPIGIPEQAYSNHSSLKRWGKQAFVSTFPKRDTYSHKGSHGKGAVIGGQRTMPGSVTLTASAALKSGAGLLTIATVEDNIPIIASKCTEAMYQVLEDRDGVITKNHTDLFKAFDGLAIGMGMGRDEVTANFSQKLIQALDMPMVIDADGLHHLKPILNTVSERNHPIIITPHFGEMAMLTGYTIDEMKRKPFSIAKEFADQYQLYVVLKGKFTIITSPYGDQIVNDTGNAGLAKGGTGDVLSGILLAMIMQNQSTMAALGNACYIHGLSAEMRVKSGENTEIDLLASDVIDGLSNVFRTLSDV
ncbi:NAD(P)H-hydrate dehydratase [Gracilibacillus oryzae]|uniref:Bifunctional NAD(P)H-hydrate repair enzyme n=1 Tax=Gracilibacillus oryzae TaxID=1672701 RepID=A0A7C8GTX9_9BACI|nr:NAD(P)H-hydrate dehydratase [Gracilibacillus oryzae]KAB8137957.1 NAD(P)H-hydrate dehydratase [Gracilibacillus oryzae]